MKDFNKLLVHFNIILIYKDGLISYPARTFEEIKVGKLSAIKPATNVALIKALENKLYFSFFKMLLETIALKIRSVISNRFLTTIMKQIVYATFSVVSE